LCPTLLVLALGCAPVVHQVAPAPPPVETRVAASEARLDRGQADDAGRALQGALCGLTRFQRAARAVYEARDYRRLFTDAEGLTAQGRQVRALLLDIHSHGLDPAWYPLKALQTPAGSSAALEVAMLQSVMQYALDFRHLKIAHPIDGFAKVELADAHLTYEAALIEDVLKAASAPVDVIRSWWPAHPHYARTREALARYRGLAKSNAVAPWLHNVNLAPGSRGPHVTALRARLQAQGFAAGPANEVFDAPLAAALSRFQRHHQIKPTGTLRHGVDWQTDPTFRALTVPMTRRVAQLSLALQRWRESTVTDQPYMLRVNIPQFELEVWQDDTRTRTHRAAVGRSPRARKNRTPVMSSTVAEVILNPIWYVPMGIKRKNLLPRERKNPGYMAARGFRIDSRRRAYQLPGPRNVLGRVKLVLPNSGGIYLHDTPEKYVFDWSRRAVSHGCVRLQDAVDLAEHLLVTDLRMNREGMDIALARKRPSPVALKTPVPIHIEYNTVTFDDSPDPIFLQDVYGYDAEFFAGAVPVNRFRSMVRRRRMARLKAKLPATATCSRPSPVASGRP